MNVPNWLGNTGPLDLASVYKASAIGFTNYIVYQSIDRSIRGSSVNFAAENTTTNSTDRWTITDNGNIIEALGGTQLSITAVVTRSGGALLMALFQEVGNDIRLYTRDAFSPSALWTAGESIV